MRQFTMGLSLLACMGAAALPAQTNFGAGATSAPWIKLPGSARLAAMADTGAALSNDANLININPAGLAGIQGHQLTLMHNIYLLDSSVEHLNYGVALGETSGLAVSGQYFNFGNVNKYQVVNNALIESGSVTPGGWAANVGYGASFDGLGLGANVKLVNQNLGSSDGYAYGADLGMQWAALQGEIFGLSLGAAFQFYSSELSGSQLPRGLKLGLASSFKSDLGTLRLLGDASSLTAENNFGNAALGAEFSGSFYALRGGYKFLSNNGAGGLTLGAGLSYAKYTLDYAYVSRDSLGASNQISVNVSF